MANRGPRWVSPSSPWQSSQSGRVHGGFEPGRFVLESVRVRWPYILSNLKSLLENGQAAFA
jgi:hypothetical protein